MHNRAHENALAKAGDAMLASERAQGFQGIRWLASGMLTAALSLLLTMSAVAQDVIGDRLVVTINNVPYSQRQVEMYIHVKESLRKTSDGTTRTISAANWLDALTVFTEDMIILQESQRLGSFQAPEQAFDKYLAVVREKIAKGPALAAALQRLGVSDQAVGRTLEEVLRIAAFRRSKERQDQQNERDDKTDGAGPGTRAGEAKWLTELVARAAVRRYGDAGLYVTIEPTQGEQASAKESASPESPGSGDALP